MVSEQEKENIRKEARKILDSFGASLSRVPVVKMHEEKHESVRAEMKGMQSAVEFKERMFANAPQKNDECIIAEKGTWA